MNQLIYVVMLALITIPLFTYRAITEKTFKKRVLYGALAVICTISFIVNLGHVGVLPF